MTARFEEFLPDVEKRVPHDPKRLFLGGISGGAMRSFKISAKGQRPWAGIYSNGGWLGGQEYYDAPYPKGLRVAMVNGNNDHGANAFVVPDTKVLTARGCIVKLFSFEGGHQVPPPMVQMKSLAWLTEYRGELPTAPEPAPMAGAAK